MSLPDPYKVLQVDPAAGVDVIAAAYKRLARRYHPDVSPDPGSVARMVQINRAWEMLRDPIRRAAVDRALMRQAGTSARVAAADGRDRATARAAQPRPAPTAEPVRAEAEWPIPGMQDPSSGTFGPRTGRATGWVSATPPGEFAGYGTRAMGSGAAGPPPGKPSGSIVTFGRYEGWTLGEIARTDLEYLEWLDRMPIGRPYQAEIATLLRRSGRRSSATDTAEPARGLFRRR